ncbi:MAG: DNA-3-methyladenine glycosylase 2 family protein [Defluviitaleaceae bacterium]|nr:DNA-3-methyladenine glycosylase 2 family protein [Defluviitaleaceae bacterium]
MDYILPANCFDLAQTLDCGQAFRWRGEAGENPTHPNGQFSDTQRFVGIAHGRRLEISRSNAGIILHDVSPEEFEKTWKRYFELERDYENLKNLLCESSPHLKAAVEFSPGLRLLRQDSWEILISFILSQNSNIPRIKKMVESIARQTRGDSRGQMSEAAHSLEAVARQTRSDSREQIAEAAHSLEADSAADSEAGLTFPSPETLASLNESDLAPVRCGYRAAYILDAARRVAGGEIDLQACENLPSDELCATLQKIHGVGPKVAECVLLYGFGRVERYPTDVWIRRAMEKYFPGGFPSEVLKISGIAQQFLFHYIRNT